MGNLECVATGGNPLRTLKCAAVLATLLLAPVHAGDARDLTGVRVPKVEKIDRIYTLTLDAPTSFGRGFQHGAALKYVIRKGVAQWKLWMHDTLGKQDPEIEIAEFIHDTDYLDGIRKHVPDL